MSLASKDPKDMTENELRIRAAQIGKPLHDSNPIHERLFELEEEARIANEKIQLKNLDESTKSRKLSITSLLISFLSLLIAAVALYHSFYKESTQKAIVPTPEKQSSVSTEKPATTTIPSKPKK